MTDPDLTSYLIARDLPDFAKSSADLPAKLASKFHRDHHGLFPYDEYLSLAWVGFMQAVRKYAPEKCGGNFGAWAMMCTCNYIRNAVRDHFCKQKHAFNAALSFGKVDNPDDVFPDTKITDFASGADYRLDAETLWGLVESSLTRPQWEQIRLVFVEGLEHASAGKKTGVSRQRSHQIKNSAIKSLSGTEQVISALKDLL